MTLTERGPAGREDPAGAPPEADVAVLLLLRFVATLVILLVAAGVLGHFAQPWAEGAARAFVERFGVLGMAFGTLLADGLQFPVPPQFYMLLAIASHSAFAGSFTAIAA